MTNDESQNSLMEISLPLPTLNFIRFSIKHFYTFPISQNTSVRLTLRKPILRKKKKKKTVSNMVPLYIINKINKKDFHSRIMYHF